MFNRISSYPRPNGHFDSKTSLLVGLPMTTAQHNRDNPFAVPIGHAKGKNANKVSFGLCHQPKSFDCDKGLLVHTH
jgi:hypothetical protein